MSAIIQDLNPTPPATSVAGGIGISGTSSGAKTPVPGPVAALHLGDAVDQLNQHFEQAKTGLKFKIDAQLDIVVVSVVNTDSGEVLRQIPTEVALRIAHDLAQDETHQAYLLKARA